MPKANEVRTLELIFVCPIDVTKPIWDNGGSNDSGSTNQMYFVIISHEAYGTLGMRASSTFESVGDMESLKGISRGLLVT